MAKLRILNTQKDVEMMNLRETYNTYSEYTDNLIEGSVVSENAKNPTTIDSATIQKWMTNPEENINDIVNYMTYMYFSDGSIYQLYTLFRSLPKLNYKIKVFDKKQQGFEDNLIKCDKVLHSIGYKRLSRDLISQACLKGTVICTWLGNKTQPYLYVFDDNEYVFSPYRRNGENVALLDLGWLEGMEDLEREMFFENFKTLKVKQAYAKYQKDKQKFQYMELPQDRTCVIKVNTIFRNQRVGMPMGLQALFDINHKKELRSLESNVVSKIIKSIAVLTIGDDTHDFKDINPELKNKIITSVQNAIKRAASANGVPVSILPQFARLNFPDVDGLDTFKDSGKFDDVNDSISRDIGVSSTLIGGDGSNFQSSKMSLEMLYSRIDMILEEVEPVFQKLFTIMLTKKIADNYSFEFAKGMPLSNKEELDVLQKLHAEGMSYKSITDMLHTVGYSELINDSIREIEDMSLRDVIVPPQSSYTLSGDVGKSGRKVNENPESDNTISSQESGGNTVNGG